MIALASPNQVQFLLAFSQTTKPDIYNSFLSSLLKSLGAWTALMICLLNQCLCLIYGEIMHFAVLGLKLQWFSQQHREF